MLDTDIDNEPVSRYTKRFHRHGRIKCLARSVWCSKNVGNKPTSVRLGTLCPICGFNPNETTRKWIRDTRLQAGKGRAYSFPAK